MLLGIDPGLTGAVAVVDAAGALVALADTPMLTLRVTRGTRHDYDVSGMCALLAPHAGAGLHVIIEQSQAMPVQGVRSMWTTGYGYGLWLGILVALAMPYTPVRPRGLEEGLQPGEGQGAGPAQSAAAFPWR